MSKQPKSKEKSGGPTAFVAHADAVYQEKLARACHELGFKKVYMASHGIHAWKKLQKEPPDYIVAGWSLPEISGVGLLNLVRTSDALRHIPFVLTAKQMTKDQVLEAGRAGVTELLVLPMPQDSLVNKLRQIWQAGDTGEKRQAEILWSRGQKLMREGRYAEALVSFEKILLVYEHAEVYYNLGYIKTAQAHYEEAIAYFRKATEINNAFAKAYKLMAQCHEKLGQLQQASDYYQKAAEVFMEQDMDQDAEDTLNDLLRLKPETINVYNSLGILYRKQKRFKEAAAQYRKALRVNPNDENIYYNLARMYYETEDWYMAREALREALALSPQFSAAQELLTAVEEQVAS